MPSDTASCRAWRSVGAIALVCCLVINMGSIVEAQTPQNKSQYMQALYEACTVYCWGDVLSTIQLSGIYNDSKTFVDMPMIFDPEVVIDNFNAIVNKSDIGNLTAFMDANFYAVGSDLDSWTPPDLQQNPPFLATITDPDYATWASDINQLWGTLGRQVNASVRENPQRHSFVPLNYPMIVPGGRFRESYYWDSWWIVKGLLVSSMPDTAMNVLNILLEDVINFGFVPNGARIYYLDRSQPPVLSEMVLDMCTFYGWSSSNTSSLLLAAYSTLETEYNWWMDPENDHIVSGLPSTQASSTGAATFKLNKYHSNGTTPRPESYVEDVTAGNGSVFWRNVRTGAETGWDFSSRWIGSPHQNMSGIVTTEIVPVDLNSILFKYEKNMAIFQQYMINHGLVTVTGSGVDAVATIPSTGYNVSHSVAYYEVAAFNRSVAMGEVLWNDSLNAWVDFNLTAMAPNDNGITSISSYIPLWAGILNGASVATRTKVLNSFQASGLDQVGGVLTTTFDSGQQWDAPNAWPPLVWFTIEGLVKLNLDESVALAQTITSQWLYTMYVAYNSTGYMYEKYNAYEVGVGGGGGEYTPQIGFGWTNGVALYLLNVTYAAKPFIPTYSDDFNDDSYGGMGEGGFAAFMVCIVFLMALFYYGYSKFQHDSLMNAKRSASGVPIATSATMHGGAYSADSNQNPLNMHVESLESGTAVASASPGASRHGAVPVVSYTTATDYAPPTVVAKQV